MPSVGDGSFRGSPTGPSSSSSAAVQGTRLAAATTATRNHDTLDVESGTLTLHFRGPVAGSVVLLDGSATIFHAPLTRNVRYQFVKCGVPIVVPGKARFDVEGDVSIQRGILDSAVEEIHGVLEVARANAVNVIEARRLKQQHDQAHGNPSGNPAEEEVYAGPRVMVVGDQNTGKSSLCRALINLVVSRNQNDYHRGVTFIDTDVGQQCVTCPGSVAAVFTEATVPVDEGFNSMMPLSFFYGDKLVGPTTRKRYLDLCACTAQACAAVGFAKPNYECGGMIINTMGWTTELGRDLLLELLSIFAVTHVVVAGSDFELEAAMRNAVLGRSVEIIRYAKQAAILKRGGSLLADARSHQLVSYFAGTPRSPLSPARGVAKTPDVTFLNALNLEPMTWQDIRPCSVAAVVWADSLETAGEANVAGYVVLLEVGKRYFSFLAPAAGDLPKPYLLVSTTICLPASKVPPINV